MPEFNVTLVDPDGELPDKDMLVTLNKVPKQGSWFDLGDGTPAQVKRLMMMSGEIVIFALREKKLARPRLKAQKRTDASHHVG